MVCELYMWELGPGWMGQWGEERDIVGEDRHNNIYFIIVL